MLLSYLRRGRSNWYLPACALLGAALVVTLTIPREVGLGQAVAAGAKGDSAAPAAVATGQDPKDQAVAKPETSAIAAGKMPALPGATGNDVLSWGDIILRSIGVLAVIAAATGRLIVWAGGKAYEEFAANLQQRRTFVQETTTRVVALAWTHYWGLATAAGRLAVPLREYLRYVEVHLLLNYDTPKQMQERFDVLAQEAASQTFPALVRLILQFQRFQFVGSNTYLLPNHESGEALRRLYNRFVISLPPDRIVATIRVRIEKYLSRTKATEKSNSAGQASSSEVAGNKSSGSAGSALVDLLDGAILEDPDRRKELGLVEVERDWKDWLSTSLMQVEAATEALEAFDALIAQELAELHSSFFRDRSSTWDGSAGIPAASAWAGERWPAIVNERNLTTIARTKFLPRSFLALGSVAMPARRDEAPRPEQASTASKDDHESGQSSLPNLQRPDQT
jgi:hypothetical protein